MRCQLLFLLSDLSSPLQTFHSNCSLWAHVNSLFSDRCCIRDGGEVKKVGRGGRGGGWGVGMNRGVGVFDKEYPS